MIDPYLLSPSLRLLVRQFILADGPLREQSVSQIAGKDEVEESLLGHQNPCLSGSTIMKRDGILFVIKLSYK